MWFTSENSFDADGVERLVNLNNEVQKPRGAEFVKIDPTKMNSTCKGPIRVEAIAEERRLSLFIRDFGFGWLILVIIGACSGFFSETKIFDLKKTTL